MFIVSGGSILPALLVVGAVCLPVLAGLLIWLIPSRALRSALIGLNTMVLVATTAGLIGEAPFRVSLAPAVEELVEHLFVVLDLALLGYAAYVGWRWQRSSVLFLALLQLMLVGWLAVAVPGTASDTMLVDQLTIILNIIVTFLGSLIIIFATKYMADLEADEDRPHHGLARFFAILLIFLGAMNGLVSTDNLRFVYLFWEITTLASFLLISHYKNSEALENSLRALWMNLLGGTALLGAIALLGTIRQSASLSDLVNFAATDSRLMLALGLLVIAALTKAAQIPFHTWLLGAMVAPTPVSALLHSSTMVNSALYLIFRLSPALGGTLLGEVTALLGAVSFVAASAMGIGEGNAKRVLAFSTVANLGLAICMGALGNPLALTAGLLLLIYHAISKGLLFLAVGAIEHAIGSRQIEKMDRLFEELPVTTLLAVVGMISMMMPPFGVLVGKWLAIEASVNEPLVLLLIIFGSAFTVAFWSKWVGKMMATSALVGGTMIRFEAVPLLTGLPLSILAVVVVLASFYLSWVSEFFVLPVVGLHYSVVPVYSESGGLYTPVGGFLPWPIFAVLAILLLGLPGILRRLRAQDITGPYLCGENSRQEPGRTFVSARDSEFTATVGNYYAEAIFGEGAVTRWAVPLATGLLLLLLGVAR